ncbi:MAG: radical SAM protein, partial [Candidatus Omnitrophota bacterium]
MSNITPKTIFFTWDIQYQCNYNCTYCFLHFEKSSSRIEAARLNTDEWLKIWEDIYNKYGECEIQVTGGEPFCYPDFINLISNLSKLHMFSFSTNLSWNVDEFINKVSPARAKIDTSFHHEFIKIRQFIEKFQKLKKNGYLVSVTMVAYPGLLEKIYDFGKEFGDHGIKLVVYPYRGPYQDRNYPEGYTKEEAVLLQKLNLQVGENVSRKLNIKHLFNPEIPAVNPKSSADVEENNSKQAAIVLNDPSVQKLCLMGHRYAKILPNGDAFRCCTAIWDETKGFDNWGSLGNLVNRTFQFYDEPRVCPSSDICACYKAMLVGEEKGWLKDWDNIAQIKENLEIRENLERIKKIRDERKPDEAIRLLQGLLVTQPQRSRIHTLLAEIYAEQNNLAEAERAVGLALKVNIDLDDLSWSYRVFGKIYVRLAFYTIDAQEKKNKSSLAFDYFSKAIQTAINSNSLLDQSEAYCEQANAYYLLNDLNKALENIDLAIQHNSQKEFLKAKKQKWIIEREISSVMVLKYRGQLDEAMDRLEKLMIEYPG